MYNVLVVPTQSVFLLDKFVGTQILRYGSKNDP